MVGIIPIGQVRQNIDVDLIFNEYFLHEIGSFPFL